MKKSAMAVLVGMAVFSGCSSSSGPVKGAPGGNGQASVAPASLTWTQQSPTTSPPAGTVFSSPSSMVYDPDIGKIVLFAVEEVTRSPLGQTWVYDGRTWTKESSGTGPPARWSAAMAYDPVIKRVVLYGGAGRHDTWEYDGATWTERHPATSPPAPGLMAYDAAIGKILYFAPGAAGATTTTMGGGGNGGGGPETWTFDGTTWKRASSAAGPESVSAMTYDSTSGKIVLFASRPDQYLASKDVVETWTYDAAGWKKQSPPTAPSARESATMAYDPRLRQAVLFGGTLARYRENDLLYDTWTYDGRTWTKRSPASSPATSQGVMAYASNIGSLVLFGPEESRNGSPAGNGTWLYGPPHA